MIRYKKIKKNIAKNFSAKIKNIYLCTLFLKKENMFEITCFCLRDTIKQQKYSF